jgi:hypothetical protein
MVGEAHPLMDHHHARDLAIDHDGSGDIARQLRGAVRIGQRLAGEERECGERKGEGDTTHGSLLSGNPIL